jgi:hypothetical protein
MIVTSIHTETIFWRQKFWREKSLVMHHWASKMVKVPELFFLFGKNSNFEMIQTEDIFLSQKEPYLCVSKLMPKTSKSKVN